MCFGGCRVTCDNCKPKFIVCPVCGRRNMLVFDACKKCKTPFTEDMKEAARDEWAARAAERERRKAAGAAKACADGGSGAGAARSVPRIPAAPGAQEPRGGAGGKTARGE